MNLCRTHQYFETATDNRWRKIFHPGNFNGKAFFYKFYGLEIYART